jgi:signal transduction histidine kinase
MRKLPADSPARDDLASILAQTDRIAAAIQTLLAPLRVPPPSRAPIDVRALVHEIAGPLRHLANTRGVGLTTELPDTLPRADADAAQLRQVLTSLLVNAVETAPHGGHVTLHARPCPDDARPTVEISICDGGAGVAPQALTRIFDPTYPTRTGSNGTSLALPVARDIVRGLGGELRVDSEMGVGTTFRFELPAAEEVTR